MSFVRRGTHVCVSALLLLAPRLHAQSPAAGPPTLQRGIVGQVVPNRFLLLYREGVIPADAGTAMQDSGARLLQRHDRLGITVVESEPGSDSSATLGRLAALPGVEAVLRDRIVSAHRITARFPPALAPLPHNGPPSAPPAGPPIARRPVVHTSPIVSAAPGAADSFYTSTEQQWAVRAVGGYGSNVPGGPAHGPWDVSMGRGVRIAILDSGVDAQHPDIRPNLALNLSEIDQSPATGLPSPCDDASPDDQQGHGTWAASLAAGALGNGTGEVVGVAPLATLLNIKVLERMPNGDGSNPAAQCPGGQASGLLSWVLRGIDEAIAQRADIISMSLGVVVDLNTGDGAGLKATFDRATHAASQAGAVLIAAAGNDGFDLGNPRYLELPAQSRDVLAIVATTNPGCAEDLRTGAVCTPGPVTRAYYSNFGAPLHALSAPGGSYPAGDDRGVTGWIRGACSSGKPGTLDGAPGAPGYSFGCFNLGHTAYVQAMGTSAAAPLAAGVAALLRAAHPDWDAAAVIAAMRAEGDASNLFGINAAATLTSLLTP